MATYPVDFLTNWNLLGTASTDQNVDLKFVCSWCNTQISSKADLQISKKRLFDHDVIATMPDVFVLDCPGCKKTAAVWVDKSWWNVDDLLKTSDHRRYGFQQVTTPGERLALWCLNSVIFKECENADKNLSFLEIPPEEYAKLYWKDGIAVAFYTLKPKDSQYSGCHLDCYCMPVVDLIFVRFCARRHGIGYQVVSDIVQHYPNQNIGFSRPVSDPMLKVLLKFLRTFAQYRTLLWETEWIGCEGYRKNIWFILSRILHKEAAAQNQKNCNLQEPSMTSVAVKAR